MDNENLNPVPANQNDDWLDDILGKQNIPKELGPDELAVKAAGLKHPDEMDLDRIVQETLAEHWPEETPATTDTPAVSNESSDEDSTRQFAVVEETTPSEQPTAAEEEAPVTPVADPGLESQQDIMPSYHQYEDIISELTEQNQQEEEKEEAHIEGLKRPKKKNTYGLLGIPHIIASVLWVMMILFIGSSIGRLAWVCAADLLALGKEPVAATIVVTEEDTIETIAEKLQTAGLIRYPSLFIKFAELTDKGANIMDNGTITFDDKLVYDYNALINALSYNGGSMILVDVMIPEGYNCAQTFALLEEKGVCTVAELENYVISLGDEDPYSEGGKERARLCADYWFLRYSTSFGHKYALEGFLFPDTYQFYIDEDPDKVIEKLLDGFNYRLPSSEVLNQIGELNQRLGTNYTIYDIITIASVIEKESANPDESYLIASVFYNRLTDSNYLRLESDATILYDTDFRSAGELVTEEQINQSPYNTYKNYGLPPTPITNPGMASLEAALDPESTTYRFFVYDKDAGVHRFSSTLDEHNNWIAQLGL